MGRRSKAQIEAERLAAESSTSNAEENSPKVAVQDTPEFKQALAAAVSDAVPAITEQILGRLMAARGGAADPATLGSDKAFAAEMAMAIAQLTDQGSGRKRVSPEIVRQRSEARDRMTQLILEARDSGAVPVYQLRHKVYLDEQLVEPIFIDPRSREQCATEIEWRAVPSEAMIPVNDVAKAIFRAFADSIGSIEHENYERPLMGVTAGGLVIRSNSAAVRPASVLRANDPAAAPVPADSEGGLGVRHKNKPGSYVERRVLGTVAAPARQTA